MSRNTSVILGAHCDQFIRDEIEAGRYASASEVIRSGLRILEEEKHKVELINVALTVGESSGKPEKFDNEQFKKEMRVQLGEDA